MKLLPATWARERPQRYPMPPAQSELPNLPPPMTINRALDFNPCKRCEVASAYADELDQFRSE